MNAGEEGRWKEWRENILIAKYANEGGEKAHNKMGEGLDPIGKSEEKAIRDLFKPFFSIKWQKN